MGIHRKIPQEIIWLSVQNVAGVINQGNEAMDTVLNALARMQESGELKSHHTKKEHCSLKIENDITLAKKLIDEWIGSVDEVTLEQPEYKVSIRKKRIRNRRKKNQCTNLETTNKTQLTK